MKKKVRLSESDICRIVSEAVNEISAGKIYNAAKQANDGSVEYAPDTTYYEKLIEYSDSIIKGLSYFTDYPDMDVEDVDPDTMGEPTQSWDCIRAMLKVRSFLNRKKEQVKNLNNSAVDAIEREGMDIDDFD